MNRYQHTPKKTHSRALAALLAGSVVALAQSAPKVNALIQEHWYQPQTLELDLQPIITPEPEMEVLKSRVPPPLYERDTDLNELVVIFDDVGNNKKSIKNLKRLIDAEIPFTASALAGGRYTTQALALLAHANADAMLHLPMEFEGMTEERRSVLERPGSNDAVLASHKASEAYDILNRHWTELSPYLAPKKFVGLNNHAGDLLGNELLLDVIADYIKVRDAILVDSGVRRPFAIHAAGKRSGAITFQRNVQFLDDRRDEKTPEYRLQHAYRATLKTKKPTIAIGHLDKDATVGAYLKLSKEAKNLTRLSELID
ncbi:MAG: divergent polysaccharide deacetylase family protein [Candidatus Nanoarchaeia archaeon]